MEHASPFLFVYGTLLDDALRHWVFGHRAPGQPDTLPGYRKLEASVAGRYPEVRPCHEKDCSVPGLRLEVCPADLERADAYETALYIRRVLPLASGEKAWVYLAANPEMKGT